MATTNRFRHQTYQSERPTSQYQLLPTVSPIDPQAIECKDLLATSGIAFRRANVEAIYCVHGTFAGNDALGLLTELSRFTPGLSHALSRFVKKTVDWVAGETGNFTPQFVSTLQNALTHHANDRIPVRLFNWSSQNNHIGRADGAIRLIYELAKRAESIPANRIQAMHPPRVLLWGHSHGGNVFALVTNLLAAEKEARDQFFHAARTFYQSCFLGKVDLPVWQEVRELLDNNEHPIRDLKLDIATFGTPVRYGWDADGYEQLLHFIHHRQAPESAEYLAPFPLKVGRMLKAADGDYIQQIGISGTNIVPLPIAFRTFLADWRLDNFLERKVPRMRLLNRLRHRTRVHDAGTTLLVDYTDVAPSIHQNLAGHTLYTRRKWLPFHCQQIAKRFYEKD